MLRQSKLLVWYKVASQKVVLGEALSSDKQDVVSMWHQVPFDINSANYNGYRLSLFDDDGREIADKPISVLTADEFLQG
ncbi:hypothetical protein M9194_20190 [Vibrio sp. S4M6]|uniref:hypothetical protein n=1 Tax=Vibrio sinus TaxID=2946865 RepID=UPI002029B4E2|nr:hypothetical protein [Vibrio sinus]MCL9783749.1 hypothetical protein [Vibrio sinus]